MEHDRDELSELARARGDRENVNRQTLPERMFDLILAGRIRNQTGMRLFKANPAKKAARKRVQAARRRNR